MGDPINPDHYKTKSGLQTIDVILAFTEGLTGIEAVCVGNIIKYITRYKKKNGVEDVRKGLWYCQYLIDYLTQQELGGEEPF